MALAPVLAAAQEEAGSTAGHPLPGQFHLQRSVTPIMDSITAFHDGILMWSISLIVALVLGLLVWIMIRYNAKRNPVPAAFTHNTLVEIAWTVLPIVVLIVIAIPSFGVLSDQLTTPDGERKYLGSNIFSFGEVEVPAPELTIKATGQQWYWDYEYVDQGLALTSIMMDEPTRTAAKPNQPRLLAVDNELVVPVDTTVRVQVTADPMGVIHAFAVPSFGIKIDAVPGRLNETWFNARETGIFYGQCSELCGKDHAFMPIAVRVVTKDEFTAYLAAFEGGDYAAANATLAAVQ
ncbi:cytochrome C oxidase subunit II [Devosia psychrophila]|uniref:Cytochrome c oxidase subunit 2 n=2 Tax=Devosia psychrophila TaxID=728005 RepID=A0A0F5PWY7_9HYPH|nr:cytochrome C oxidase subunit II [Devosia psychrophila]SFC29748.1 cytochrome c oxidase subunit 2 [Devosia psychrophila]